MRKSKRTVEPPENTSRLIRKSNELVEARYRYDIWQMRVFTKVLSMINPSDNDFYEYRIYLTEFIKEFKLNKGGNIYQHIKKGAEGLLQKKVVVDELLDGKISELQTWLLSSVQAFKDPNEAKYLQVTIHPKLRPYLLELRQKYLVYDIRNVLGTTSVYSIRIYELLKQYEKIGRRHFDVENLKLILGILPEEYKLYGHFKDKVILKAQTDLAAETDIAFDFEETKDGKKVVGLTFFIRQNAAGSRSESHRHELPEGQGRGERSGRRGSGKTAGKTARVVNLSTKAAVLQSPFFEQVAEATKGWGITEIKLRELFVEHGEEKVKNGLDCTLDTLREGKIKDSPGGFFIRAVEEGWRSGRQARQQQAAESRRRAETAKAKFAENLAQRETALENLLDERRGSANEVVRMLAQRLPDLAEQAVGAILVDNFSRTMLENSTGLSLENLSLDDWRTHRMLRDAVIRQIEKMFPDDFRKVQEQFDEAIRVARRSVTELRN